MYDQLDKAKGDGGMSMRDLLTLVEDIALQPQWRQDADRAAAYYDGKQLSGARLEELRESGEPATIVNLIFGVINGALGQEAKTRLDWRASADNDAWSDVADVFSMRLKEAQRESLADQAISDAYKGQLVPGIGWAYVSRSPDPLAYPYRVEVVHRNEVWWDWRGRRSDLSRSRWMCMQAWVDLDEAIEQYPEHADVFKYGCGQGPLTDALLRQVIGTDTFDRIAQTRRAWNRFEEEWLDFSARRRIRFYDVFYRKPKTMTALVTGTSRVLFRPENPLHLEAVRRGISQLITGPSYEMRHARFAGPYRLFDVARKGRKFPLIPFVGFTDDEYGTPYGLGKGMLDPQDEYNERRSRLRWLLKAAQVFVDNDALDPEYNNFRDLAARVLRPDATFILNAARRNANGLRIEQNVTLAREQVDVMQDAKQLIQEQPRIYSTMLGDAPNGVTSGLAINSLVEQGMVALGETNDSYRTGRAAVGEALSELIAEDLSQANLRILLGKGETARVVVLNTFDERGLPRNHVQDAPVSLGLGDVPSTPAYRMQQQTMIGQTLQTVGNDPIARAVLLPALIESSDLPNREADAKWVREQYGSPMPGASGPQQDEARKQAQAEQQAKAAALEDAALKKAQAEAAKTMTEVELNQAKLQQMQQQSQQIDEDTQIREALDEAAA